MSNDALPAHLLVSPEYRFALASAAWENKVLALGQSETSDQRGYADGSCIRKSASID